MVPHGRPVRTTRGRVSADRPWPRVLPLRAGRAGDRVKVMIDRTGLRGTGNASLAGVAEGILILAAAIETVLLAGLVLIAGRVGQGSGLVAAFMRLNTALLRPLDLIAFPSGAVLQQIAAMLGYGVVCFALVGALSWLERRRTLY